MRQATPAALAGFPGKPLTGFPSNSYGVRSRSFCAALLTSVMWPSRPVVINPLRDGSKGGLFVSVTLPDGKVMGDPTRARGGPINVPQIETPPAHQAP